MHPQTREAARIMPSTVSTERLLLTPEAAQVLGFAEKTLEKDRCTRELGIPYVKLGRSVRYRMTDLQKFIADRVVA
jgi:predicted DNA-binding transcriptional regulator AlpA